MSAEKFELVVMGGGPGGYVAAIRASQLGLRVALIEREGLGGTCTHRGCIPTKALLRSAEIYRLARVGEEFGVRAENIRFDLRAAMVRKDRIVSRLAKGIESLIASNGIELLRGEGRLRSGGVVEIRGGGSVSEIRFEKLIIATGSSPLWLPIPGARSTGVITSDEALRLEEVPRSLVVIGGGAVGLEFAALFGDLGSSVTVLEMMPQILPGEDPEAAGAMAKALRRRGITIETGSKVSSIEEGPGGLKLVRAAKEGGQRIFEGELVLMAAGRAPNTKGIGLEEAGVAMDGNGRIVVNDRMETNVPGIFAVGDAVGKRMFAHSAMAEGIVAAENAAGLDSRMDYAAVPRCVYGEPEVASVGLSEAEARETHGEVIVGRFPMLASGRALTLGERDGFVKLVADARYKALLGAQIVGPNASELIHEIAVAMRSECTLECLAEAIHAHPTLAEAIREAALDGLGRALHMHK
ncbi:MAG: dihydrolipoyl dehydrogenase [Candidatus Bathyarchaeia archaeon]